MIRFDHVGVRFGSKQVFRGFSFSVEPGERIALTGPSGSGKSTVLGCLLGWVQPDEGQITIGGTVLNSQNIWGLRQQMALVPQEADLGAGTVNAFLERPFTYAANRSLRSNLERIPALFDALGLPPGLRETTVATLSGGEKQRLALIAALLLDRPLLIMDEVTSALDADSAARVAALLGQREGTTMLGVVHEGSRMPFATRTVEVPHDT